jgi:hypothetical protein
MGAHRFPDPVAVHNQGDIDAETVGEAPRFVTAMLQNVYLYREKTTPPVEHRGDFWYWKLTPYGLALMHALVRASVDRFSYFETFTEPDLDAIPQLVFLGKVNAVIEAWLTNTSDLPDCTTILNRSQYLHEKRIVVDPATFQREIHRLIEQIRQGCYDAAGDRVYRCLRKTRSEARNTGQ